MTKRTTSLYLPALNSCLLNGIEDEYRQERGQWRDEYKPHQFDIFHKDCDYYVKNSLLSVGHEPYKKVDAKYKQVLNREKDTIILGDSGGFQIAMNKLKIDWSDPNPVRLGILRYLERNCTYAMTLDVPTFTIGKPGFRFDTFQACLDQTVDNLHYWMDNKDPESGLKFLNVLQGRTEAEVETWYQAVKFADCQGWSFSSANSDCVYYMIRTAIMLAHRGEITESKKWIHVLGRTVPAVSVILTELQNRISEMTGVDLQISYDSASFKDAANSASVYDPNLGDNLVLRQRKDVDFSRMYCMDKDITIDEHIGTKTTAGSAMKLKDMYIWNEKLQKYHWPSTTYAVVMATNIELSHQAMANAEIKWNNDELTPQLLKVKHEIFPAVFAKDTLDEKLAELSKHKMLLSHNFIKYKEPNIPLDNDLFTW